MSEGWIKLHRCVMDNELWQQKPFSRAQAWIDLILIANHRPGVIWPRGIETPVQRGQVGWSQVKMADRWGWSRGAVQDFFKYLERKQQIQQQNNNVSSIITIINYEKYQEEQQQKEQQNSSRAAAKQQQSSTNKNGKNEKNEKNTTLFDEFWTLYPKKVGKGAALKAWTSRHCGNGHMDKIRSTLAWEVQSEQWRRDNGQYIPNPATWINQERWTDEPPNRTSTSRDLARSEGVQDHKCLFCGIPWVSDGIGGWKYQCGCKPC